MNTLRFILRDNQAVANRFRIPIHSTEHLMKQSTKRVRIEVKDKLDNKSSSNSPKIERLTYALHSSDVNDLVQRRKTL